MQVSVSVDVPGNPRIIFYRVIRGDGSEYEYGPVFTSDENYNTTDQLELIRQRLEAENG